MNTSDKRQWQRLLPAVATLAFASCTTDHSEDSVQRPQVNARAQAVATAPALGASSDYGVLAGNSVNSNNTNTTVTGDVGADNNVNGFPPATATGTIAEGAATDAAQTAAESASTALAVQACDTTEGPGNIDLAGRTFTPGVHCFTGPASISAGGTVTLDFQGDSNAVFVFLFGTAFTSQADANIVVTNSGTISARGCNVFWRSGTAFTLGADVTFIGNIFASTAATLGANTTVQGRVFSGNSTNLNNNQITAAGCESGEPDAGSEDSGVEDAGEPDASKPDAGGDGDGDGDHDVDCAVPDPCLDCPCVHGTCTVSDQGAAYCICEPGYTGTYCDQCVYGDVTQQ